MRKFLVAAVCVALTGIPPAAAQTPPCFMNTLQNSSGAYVTLSSGFAYLVAPGRDRVTAGQWMPLDKLQVCRAAGSASKITNLSKTPPNSITAIMQTR